MKSNYLPFSLPDIGEEEIAEVVDTLRSGWVTTGPKAKKFENDFSEFLGGGLEALAVNSATSGLHLALEALGVGPGHEVILPSYTFTATAEVVRYLGATPIIVDVDENTFNICPASIEAAITDKTRVIVPVHFGGLSCDMGAIFHIARKYGLSVVEDAAHALPATWKGQIIGTLESDATVFSFYANKTMTTGEGGMLVTNNSEIAKRCRIMRLHGIDRDAFDRYSSTVPAWFYAVVAPGFKYNMSDMAAALGIHQLRRLWGFQRRRHEIATYYNDYFKDLPLVLPPAPMNGELHAWHLYPIRLDKHSQISRDDFIHSMSELQIGCSVHFIPLHLQPYWKESCNLRASDFPVSEKLYREEVSLPLFTRMSDSDVARVAESVRRVLVG